jgi:hypothetical protein
MDSIIRRALCALVVAGCTPSVDGIDGSASDEERHHRVDFSSLRDAAVGDRAVAPSDLAVAPVADLAVAPVVDLAAPSGKDAAPPSGACNGDVPCATPAPAPSAACRALLPNYGAGLVESSAPSTSGYPESSLALPAAGATVVEPDFHTCLTRATPLGWMNGYARFTAFNADATRLLVRQAGGAWYVLDAAQLGTPQLALNAYGDSAAARWHGTDPDVLFYLAGSKLVRYHVSTRATETAFDVATAPGLGGCGGVAAMSLGGDEGEASAGSRFWGFQVQTGASCNGNTDHFVTVDLATGASWVHTLPSGDSLPDNSSMSATGKWLVANFQGSPCSGGDGTLARPCGVMAYPLHLDTAKNLHPNAGHHDEIVSRDGHDMVVVKSNSTDYIEAVDVETLALTRIAAMNLPGAQAWDYHVSGGNWAVPGWVLLSEDSYDQTTHYLSRQIVAVEIADFSTARVIHLAHHRTRSNQYWTQECHASVNADFTRVAFHSNWYGGADESQDSLFFVEIPPGLVAAQ